MTGPDRPSARDAVGALGALLGEDIAAVERLVHDRMGSAVALIPHLAGYLIDAGGKRIRPLVTLAAAQLVGGPGNAAAHKLAAAVEFIHTATLLHDDVVDQSALRRGKTAANLIWGNASSVLVGDFLFARSFNLMVEAGDLATLDVLARAASVIAEGEVMQLAAAQDGDIAEGRYLEIINAKTAALFAAAARVGVMAAGRPEAADTLAAYGRNIGMAFQLVDDALDYGGQAARMGKNVGDDFREGKITLPVVLARESADSEETAFWRRCFTGGARTDADFERALAILRRRGAIAQTIQMAAGYAQAAQDALAPMAPSPVRNALIDLADFVVDRAH
jgi:octaprenyl-diphosphate synthase